MVEFGAAMTGVKPKTVFLKPSVAVPVTIQIFWQVLRQKIFRTRNGREAYRVRAVERDARPTAFANACLVDPAIPPG